LAAMADTRPPALKIDSRRNFTAFTLDIMLFMVGLNFLPTATVLVGFANRLTDNPVLIGIVGMAWAASWYLPQLIAARIVHGKHKQKPYLIWPSLIGRQMFFILAAWVFLTNAAQPLLTIWIMVACIVFFNICDALAGVSWFDMLSRALSPRLRGRVVAIGQFAGSILGLGVGVVVQRVLAPDGLPFPQNYAFIFACGWIFFNFSLIAVLLLQELPMSEEQRQTANEHGFGKHLRESLTDDPLVRQTLIARGLTSLEAMAAAFYLVFITNQLGLTDESVGTFTIAAIVGGGVGIALFGAVSERVGTRRVAQMASALQFLNPLMALAVALFPSVAGVQIAGTSLAFIIFIIIMAANGAIGHSLVLGFLGYLMDIAPESRRAIYVGIMNTMGGVIALAPLVGGIIIEVVSKVAPTHVAYAVVFGLVAICTGVGFVLSLRLPTRETRQS